MLKLQNLRLFTYSLIIILFSISCASSKKIIYFQGDADLNTIYENNIPKIQPDDILSINVTAVDSKAAAPFNQMSAMGVTPTTLAKTYSVQRDGTIDFPILGKISVGGLNRQEATNLIKTKLNQYIIDPGVEVNFTNFRVSVMGEVARPGTFTLPNERVTVLEAIAMAGDLSIQGVRENVLVIREIEGKKMTFTLDLTKKEVLNSPAYYLKQNDLVYVEPNNSKVQSSKINYTVWIAAASLIVTLVSLLKR
jgi:polysaccharide export outer membrane protein